MDKPIRDIFDAFEGQWSVTRTIAPGGKFEGRAAFNRVSENILAYQEEGQMTLDDGSAFEANRKFTYKFENGQIAVYYADGQDAGTLFHALIFDEVPGRAFGEHMCKKDFYVAEYLFDLPEAFTLIYKVKGPNKDYVSESVFTRAP